MVMSMTGFGRDKQTVGNYDVTVEIRSVNHRYFEFSSRLPRFYTFLEERLKTFCREKITRGKVEVSVLIEDRSEDAVELELNRQYADAYIKALRSLAQEYHLKDDISVSSVIGNQDIFNVRRFQYRADVVRRHVLYRTVRTARNRAGGQNVPHRDVVVKRKITLFLYRFRAFFGKEMCPERPEPVLRMAVEKLLLA